LNRGVSHFYKLLASILSIYGNGMNWHFASPGLGKVVIAD